VRSPNRCSPTRQQTDDYTRCRPRTLPSKSTRQVMSLPIHNGEGKLRNRRPTPLRLGSSNLATSPQLAVHPDPLAGRSPSSPIFYSPTLEISPPSASSSSHFSQLPPSPPLAGGEWVRSPDFITATAAYPTPPGSDSGRVKTRSPGVDTREYLCRGVGLLRLPESPS
jgi:hypothetical protein